MRIISGSLKGRRLVAPKKLPVRPTTDMAKESLFNILNNNYDFEDLHVLDLFTGTGNISFEFASRGTSEVTAVDAHSGCVNFVSKTAKTLNLNIHTVKMDVFKFLHSARSTYDIIFADPPYHLGMEQFAELVQLVISKKLLQLDGLLIIEHASHTDLSNLINFREARKYGSSSFSFFSPS